jgi:D-amino-acid dehydrogenase
MLKEVIIIGGGVIGLCSAYYLQKEGHKVTVIDMSNMDAGASYVNAGYISPSHLIPLSAPGVMKKGLKWMFNPASPLYIKPRLNIEFLKWVWAFNRSCNQNHVKKAIPAIKDITVFSQELYDEIRNDENFKFHFEKKGLLMLCQTDKMLEEESKIVQLAKNEGFDAEILSTVQLKKLEPNAVINAIGASYYKCDYHSTPHEFMEELKVYLGNNGVELLKREKVEGLELYNNKILSVKTTRGIKKADEFVLASGSWSPLISKKIGLKMLLQAGKGYRIDSKNPTGITIPAILTESKVAITPMNGFTRFAGTMEIAGINEGVNKIRVNAISKAVSKYYPEIQLTEEEKSNSIAGLRPLSPDGLPFIGKSKSCENLTIATGHAMMGWSMATATGKLVSEIISEKKTSLNLSAFNPDRSF